MDTSLWQIKKQMCDIGHRIWLRGYCAGNEGNHSVRIGDDRILCTPSGLSKGFLESDDICVVDMAGTMAETNPRGRKRSSEVKLHLAIYEHQPEVKAVVHSHPPHATAFAVVKMPIPEGIHPEAEVFLGKVPIADYATPSTDDLPASVLPLIGPQTNSVLMGNHGTVSFSGSLLDAYYKLEILDSYCRLLLLCRQLGEVNTLTERQLIDLLQVKKDFGLSDDRLDCVEQGCIGQDNQPFLAQFDVRPMSATCSCHGSEVEMRESEVSGTPPTVNEDRFESVVEVITDHVLDNMARRGR